MSNLREAAQQALEALETPIHEQPLGLKQKAIADLRAALEQQAEPVLVVEKEPDYWSGGHFHQGSKPHIDPTKVWGLRIGTKLYTAPPQRKPLTDDEILEMVRAAPALGSAEDEWLHVARAIERAHGIKEKE